MTYDFGEPQSRNEAILQNILGADNEILPPVSRIEELLIDILEQGGGGYELPVATASELGGVKVDAGNSVKFDADNKLTANMDSMEFVRILATVFYTRYLNTGYAAYIDDPAKTASEAAALFTNVNEAVIDGNIGAAIFVSARDDNAWEYEDENYDPQTREIKAGTVYVLRLIDSVLEFKEATNSIMFGLICYGLDWKGE